jgi:ABC-2 type transport system ATP-binding protein
MLQFLNVKKEYGQRLIISIPELTLSEGIYWLTGANGSGKTSLLKMMAGLIPFSGQIKLDGVDLRKSPFVYRRLVGSAEAEPAYPIFLTGRELIGFYQEVRNATESQIKQLIDRLGFGQFLHTPIGTYSSGMIKRLSLLLAFIGHTKLVLLDEPLATLDMEALGLLPSLIEEYRKEYNTSFIFSSHATLQSEEMILSQKLLLQDQSIHLIA